MNCIATHVFLTSRENDNWITFSGGHSGCQKYRRMSQCPSTIQYHVTDNPPWISQASRVSPVETWGIRGPVDPHHHTMVMKSTCNEAELKFFFNGIRPRHRPHGLLWTTGWRKSGDSPVDKHDLGDIIVTSLWHRDFPLGFPLQVPKSRNPSGPSVLCKAEPHPQGLPWQLRFSDTDQNCFVVFFNHHSGVWLRVFSYICHFRLTSFWPSDGCFEVLFEFQTVLHPKKNDLKELQSQDPRCSWPHGWLCGCTLICVNVPHWHLANLALWENVVNALPQTRLHKYESK